ncbi:MAG: alkyl hydroperoxide reductase [Oceanospirillaceae bacterium]|nr:alkyl hydroperoxide reductase [Oceanospirillaceae bacterium]|tara:strand:+ start:39432 stop:40277 length:846 start_codon:yes stop_codon:yes gene_type:complete
MLMRLKAAYVSLYMTGSVILSAFAAWQILSGAPVLSWSGVLLAALPMTALISLLMIRPLLARTRPHLPEIHLLTLAGVVIAASGFQHSLLPTALASVAYGGFLLYVYWYSRYQRQPGRIIRPGFPLPDVELTDQNGQVFTTTALTAKPAVWLFYRGNWCPLCMAQIREIASEYREIEQLGADVILISPQPHAQTEALARRMQVNFRYMTDTHNQAARTLGIVSDFGIPTGLEVLGYDTEAPMPTVIITAAGGKVLWADETDNYRVRPEPGVFLKVLREQGA